ncbi:cobalamin-independent synthase, partial [Helicosporidium sp. ATCC 50920]
SSVSLQHVPLDASVETDLDPELRRGLCFAEQKLAELVRLAGGAGQGARAARPLASFGAPPPDPAESGLPESAFQRSEPYDERRPKQAKLPAFATTTIGSFPQTERMRKARLARNRGALSEEAYRERVAAEIGYAIGAQEALEVDVLVHGEAERSDMVEYFGVALQGVAFTQQGWVQSYGSRYVRPPVIAGDVSRRGPMTVREFELAQSLTSRPVKGMLTGPVTILNWSFPRKDISRAAQARQLALALRDEVADLERAGCAIVQVDEPALREGLPLKPERWAAYLSWAVRAFCLATAGARPETQVVTHLCYSSFEDVLGAIEAMDADVLTIENSRSDDAMVRALARGGYRRDLGPGVYDVHSPVVPEASAMADKLRSFVETGAEACRPDRLWVNPDCGLKTRRWEEVLPSIRNMVRAAKTLRGE